MAQFPDLLSAPAPVLRNDVDLLVDDETVVFAPPQYQAHRPPPINSDGASTLSAHYDSYSSPSPPAMSAVSVSSSSGSSSYGSASPQGGAMMQAKQGWDYSSSPTKNSAPLTTWRDYDNQPSRQQQEILADYDPYSENPCPKSGAIIPRVSYDASSKISTRPPEVSKMRTRRKVATATAGVCGGIIGLAVLGPVGGVMGGVGGAVLCKSVGKRRERKKTERIAAQRHAVEERQFGREIQAFGSEFL